MPRLEDLRRDILGETREQLLERFRAIREDRKIVKGTKKVKAAKKEAGKKKDVMSKLLGKLSPEDMAALLREMGE